MNFESLANELIFEIFEYLTSIELIENFYRLNNRFNNLLFEYFHQCPLDFRSISKQNFLSLCQNQLPSITNEICSIYISNEDETFDQLNLFYSLKFNFQQFTKLKYLTLESINSTELVQNILFHCSQLIYLNLVQCYFDTHTNSIQICLNTIWSLKKLQSCYLNEFFIHLLNQISLSIIYLSINHHPLSFDCLVSLFSYLPNIQYLTIEIRDLNDENYFSFPILTLTNLTINFRGQWNTLKNFFQHLPNLIKLKIEIFDCLINGYEWEDLINNSLIYLQTFQYLNIYQYDDDNFEYDKFFESFCTNFWLDKYQWFIRCDCHSESRMLYLFTLPYCFRKFHSYDYNQTRTTNKYIKKFSYVKEILFENNLSKFSFEFPKIEHLELAIPFHEQFWLSLSNLDCLKSLEINSIAHSNEFERAIDDLHIVLEKSIHLYSLTIDYLILSQLVTSQRILNYSIRRLDLMVNDGHFYGNECLNLIENFLNNQCEVLLINIECREIINDIILRFTNLRTLIIQCQDDNYDENDNSIDELLIWLKENLAKTYSINRDENEISVIRIWIA